MPPSKWPCIFTLPEVWNEIDPAIADAWLRIYGTKAPFGDLRRTWKRDHCRTLNPYGSDDCPYARGECLAAFCDVVLSTLSDTRRSPGGFFRTVARNRAARRADERPPRSSQPHTSRSGAEAGPPSLRGAGRGFESIGDLLTALRDRSRQVPASHREARPVPPREPRDAVQLPPSGEPRRPHLGDDQGAPGVAEDVSGVDS